MSEEQFLPISQNLVSHLLSIVKNKGLNEDLRVLAIDVFMSCLDSLEMLTSTRRDGIRVFVDHALPPWLEVLTSIIVENRYGALIQSKATESIIKLRLLFPSQLVQYLPALFTPIYNSLLQFNSETNEEFSKLVESQIEFLRKSIQARIIIEEVLTDHERLQGCIAIALKFAQIYPSMEEEWHADVDGFVQDLEETSFSIRHLSTDLLEDLIKINPPQTTTTLESVVNTYFVAGGSESNLARKQEAIIFCLDSLNKPTQYTQQILHTALTSSDPFLLGRGLLYAASLGVAECMNSVREALTSNNIFVKLCAIKAVAKYSAIAPELVRQHQSHLLASMTTNLDQIPTSALLMLAETLSPAIALNPSIVFGEPSPLPDLFEILSRNPGDISLVSTVVDIFESLASSVDFTNLCNAVLPIVLQTITTETTLRPIAFDILNGLLEGANRLPDGFVAAIWPAFRVDVDVDESQTIHGILKSLVQKAWDQVLAGGFIDELIFIIRNAFKGDESASFFVPDLVIAVIRHSGDRLSHIMPQLLGVIIEKLTLPGTSTRYQQNLLSVFAIIATTQASQLIEFLQTIGALEIVLSRWCESFPDIHGYAAIRANVVGLAQIYAARNSAVEALIVKGDLIPDTSGRIVTRSRAKTSMTI